MRQVNLIPRSQIFKKPELQIQKEILEWLGYQRDVKACSIDTKGTWDVKRSFFRKTKTTIGFPDIVRWHSSGQIFFIEVKSHNGRQSDAQKEFQKMCEKSGAFYSVCRSIDDVVAYVSSIRTYISERYEPPFGRVEGGDLGSKV